MDLLHLPCSAQHSSLSYDHHLSESGSNSSLEIIWKQPDQSNCVPENESLDLNSTMNVKRQMSGFVFPDCGTTGSRQTSVIVPPMLTDKMDKCSPIAIERTDGSRSINNHCPLSKQRSNNQSFESSVEIEDHFLYPSHDEDYEIDDFEKRIPRYPTNYSASGTSKSTSISLNFQSSESSNESSTRIVHLSELSTDEYDIFNSANDNARDRVIRDRRPSEFGDKHKGTQSLIDLYLERWREEEHMPKTQCCFGDIKEPVVIIRTSEKPKQRRLKTKHKRKSDGSGKTRKSKRKRSSVKSRTSRKSKSDQSVQRKSRRGKSRKHSKETNQSLDSENDLWKTNRVHGRKAKVLKSGIPVPPLITSSSSSRNEKRVSEHKKTSMRNRKVPVCEWKGPTEPKHRSFPSMSTIVLDGKNRNHIGDGQIPRPRASIVEKSVEWVAQWDPVCKPQIIGSESVYARECSPSVFTSHDRSKHVVLAKVC